MTRQQLVMLLAVSCCLFISGCSSSFSDASTSPTNFPRFSWNTLPVFWHAWGREPFNASTLDFINRFPLVTIEKGMSGAEAPAGRHAEEKIVAAAEQVKKRNSTIKVLFYLNSLIDWKMYDLHQYCLQHKEEMWVYDEKHEPVMLHDEAILNMSSAQVRQVWLNVLKQANQSGWIDGVFADRGGDPVERQPTFRGINPEKFKELVLGHRELMTDLHRTFGSDFLSVANHQDYTSTTGRMFERFMLNDKDHAQAYSDLLLLMHETSYPHIAEVHIEPCTATTYNTTLAGYLVGAGRYAYYGCTDGFSLDTGWLKWHADYSKPLGEPISNATTITSAAGFCKKSSKSGSEDASNSTNVRLTYNHFWTKFQHHAAHVGHSRHALNAWVREYWTANLAQPQPVFGRKFSSGTCVTLDFNSYPPESCISWSDGTHTGSSTQCLF